MKFFHFAPMRLGVGSVIEPGNFGRVMIATQIAAQAGDGSSLVAGYVGRELIFELIRVHEHPDKPSRLFAIFGCPTLEDANLYAAHNNPGGRQLLHEVEIVDLSKPMHIGSLSFCDITIGALFFDTTAHRADLYWKGELGDPAKGRELLVESPVRVIRTV